MNESEEDFISGLRKIGVALGLLNFSWIQQFGIHPKFFRSSKSCLSGHFKLLPSSSQQRQHYPPWKKLPSFSPYLDSAPESWTERTAFVGLSTGVVNYMGDLGNEKYFPFSSASPGAAVTLRNFLGGTRTSRTMYRPFDLQVRLSWHRLQYDETSDLGGKKGTELRNYNRGINFGEWSLWYRSQ